MFTLREIQSIDTNYFHIIDANLFTVTVQSQSTKHCWHIEHQSYPHFSSCKIYHTHNTSTPYHLHGHATTLHKALIQIMEHDAFQLNHRK